MTWTLEDLKEFQENILGPTDTFQFSCKGCGDCCRKQPEPIALTGLDVFRLARALETSPLEVVDGKTINCIGTYSHIPVLALKERSDGSCCLLHNGKCLVHSSKPVNCALYPLGRMYNSQKIIYFMGPHRYVCQAGAQGGKTWTLQEWLDKLNISDLDEASKAWDRMVAGVSKVTSKIDRDKLSSEMMAIVEACLYLNYDINKPYVQQVEENMGLLKYEFKRWFNKEIVY